MAEKENQTIGNFSKLLTVSNQVEAGMVEELKNEQIACYRRDRELGSFLRVSMGYSVYGEDIFVSNDQLENAKEVLKDSFLAAQDKQDEEDLDGEDSAVMESYGRRRRLAARIVIIVLAVIMMFVLLLNLIH